MRSQNFKEHFKQNLNIAIPVCLSQAGHILVGVVDSIMVGHLGKEPLAAAALSNSIFNLPLVFGIGISYGITPFIAAADGERNLSHAGNVFKHGIIINFLTAAILTLLFYSLAPFIRLLDQPEEVVVLTIPYFRLVMLGLIPLMIFQAFKQFAEGLSLTKQAMYISIAGNIFNIFGNYVLIYGKWGFPEMGLNGAAVSTLVSRILMAIVMGLYIFYSRKVAPYISQLKFKSYSLSLSKSILKIGIPSGLQFMFEVTAFGVAAIMMGWIGTRELAAHQIAISLAGLTYMFATGFSAGAVVRVGNYFGKKDRVQLRIAGIVAFVSVALFMGFCGLIFIIGNNYFPTIYIEDQAVIEVASHLLIIAAFFQISDGVQVVGLGALRGMTDVKVPTIITFIAYWVIGLPVGWVLSSVFSFGALGIWTGLLIGLSVSAILLYFRFNSKSRSLVFNA